MKDLEYLNKLGVDTNNFIKSSTPNFKWDLNQNTFKNRYSDNFGFLKSYQVQHVSIEKIKEFQGLVVWYPSDDIDILRCATILNFPILLENLTELGINTSRFIACDCHAFDWNFDTNYFTHNTKKNSLKFVLKKFDANYIKDFSGIVVYNIRKLILYNTLYYCKIKKY